VRLGAMYADLPYQQKTTYNTKGQTYVYLCVVSYGVNTPPTKLLRTD